MGYDNASLLCDFWVLSWKILRLLEDNHLRVMSSTRCHGALDTCTCMASPCVQGFLTAQWLCLKGENQVGVVPFSYDQALEVTGHICHIPWVVAVTNLQSPLYQRVVEEQGDGLNTWGQLSLGRTVWHTPLKSQHFWLGTCTQLAQNNEMHKLHHHRYEGLWGVGLWRKLGAEAQVSQT